MFDRCRWLNEPTSRELRADELFVTFDAKTDFRQETHYGFAGYNGQLFEYQASGDFTATLRVRARYDHSRASDRCAGFAGGPQHEGRRATATEPAGRGVTERPEEPRVAFPIRPLPPDPMGAIAYPRRAESVRLIGYGCGRRRYIG